MELIWIIIFTYFEFVLNYTIDPELVGGRLARQNEFPYYVSIRNISNNNVHICGGAIISPIFILTGAQCVYSLGHPKLVKANTLGIISGPMNIKVTNRTVFNSVINIIVHPNYNPTTVTNDIALLQLKDELKLKKGSSAFTVKMRSKTIYSGKCVICGFGILDEGVPHYNELLLAADVDIVDKARCQKEHEENEEYEIRFKMSDKIICTTVPGLYNTCEGDAGGPIVCDNLLTAVVSKANGCERDTPPQTNTDVASMSEWIQKTMEPFNELQMNTTKNSNNVLRPTSRIFILEFILLLTHSFFTVY